MKFQEIFEHDGLYKTDSFREGVAFKVEQGTLYMVVYADKNDMNPSVEIASVYKRLFDKNYTKVYTRQSLFFTPNEF